VGLFPQERFQSTLPARGATKGAALFNRSHDISIHAPRTGSDGRPRKNPPTQRAISIHAPRTGSNVISRRAPATFNPRSLHGERR